MVGVRPGERRTAAPDQAGRNAYVWDREGPRLAGSEDAHAVFEGVDVDGYSMEVCQIVMVTLTNL